MNIKLSGRATYQRVIPRDLFNEGNLLKCYGQLYLRLESMNAAHVELWHDGGPFHVMQDESDGSLRLLNVHLLVRGVPHRLRRPLNSRSPYPLWLLVPGLTDDEISVFNDDGTFTDEMVAFLQRGE